MAPDYLSELIHEYVPPRALRSMKESLLVIPKCKLSKSERSFSVGGPKIWNSLSHETRKSKDMTAFKTSLKTELFRRAF